jgi:hypothetical protein
VGESSRFRHIAAFGWGLTPPEMAMPFSLKGTSHPADEPLCMKGPLIVPDGDRGPSEPELPQQVPSRRLGEFTRLASAAMVLAASLVGLASHFLGDGSKPTTHATPAGPRFLFGDLHAGQHRGGAVRPRSVCTKELRVDPAAGPWICLQWEQLAAGGRAAQASDPGGPCSSRWVEQETGWWKCDSYRKVITYGGLTVRRRQDKGKYGACVQERRASPTHGAWHCVIWNDKPAWMPIREPRDPGGPCLQRIANQYSGTWDCFQTSPSTLTPLPDSRLHYRGGGPRASGRATSTARS